MAQSVTLPKAATAVRHEHERLLVREGAAIRVIGLDGAVVRSIDTSVKVRDFRRVTVDDAALLPDGSVEAYVNASLGLGETVYGVLRWPVGGSGPDWYATGNLQCAALTADRDFGLWCLGVDRDCLRQGPDCAMFHRLTPMGVRSQVSWKSVGWKREGDDFTRLPWQSSNLGSPALMWAGGAIYAWVPSAEMLVRFEPESKRLQTWNVPLRPAGRVITSMTVTPDGRVFALFPLERNESLDGRYGFYELDTAAAQWRPLPQFGSVPRGSRLAGSSARALFVWDRAGQKVTSLPVR